LKSTYALISEPLPAISGWHQQCLIWESGTPYLDLRTTITGKHGYEVPVDMTLNEANSDDYAILVLPGGVAPAEVRKEPTALDIARDFFVKNKPVAAICQRHRPRCRRH
jgi:putative intracellular protease/amidase